MAPHLPRTLALSAAVLGGMVTGCGGDDASAGGFDSAREVVDAHVSRSKAYDLAGDCELHHPDVVAEWASADGREADGYCEWATASLQADATPDQRARTTGIYTDPKVSAGTEDGDRATFRLGGRRRQLRGDRGGGDRRRVVPRLRRGQRHRRRPRPLTRPRFWVENVCLPTQVSTRNLGEVSGRGPRRRTRRPGRASRCRCRRPRRPGASRCPGPPGSAARPRRTSTAPRGAGSRSG